jgi:hypothetical protein
VAYIRDHFVPLVVDNYLAGTPVEQEFYERAGGVSNGFLVVAASGKAVGHVEGWEENLAKLLAAYRRLPDADRKPKLEKDLGKPNPDQMPPVPPAGGLTLIIYNTPLERTAKGDLIRARNLMAPGPSWALETPITLNDLLWLTREEWQALVPQNPQKGQKGRVPETAQRRLFMFNGYDWSCGYQNDALPLRSGELTWVVEEVTENEIRSRLEGFSKVGAGLEEARKCPCKDSYRCSHWGTELSYRGFMKFDRFRKTISEFRLVGLGETTTKHNRTTLRHDREVNVFPTGLVVELAADCPANRNGWHPLAPYRMRHARIDYWKPGR